MINVGGLIMLVFWSIGVGYIATRRLRNPYAWFIISLLITPLLSTIIIFILKKNQKEIACPSCGELVGTCDAVCAHCNYSLAGDKMFTAAAKKFQHAKKSDAEEKSEWEEKNRIATEGYEAFRSGLKISDNPYRSIIPKNAYHVSYWDRGFSLAARREGEKAVNKDFN